MPAGGSSPRLSRQTIIIAADLLKSLGHTGFDRLLLEYGISDLEELLPKVVDQMRG